MKISIPGSQTTTTLQNLHPAQIYHLRILAENRLGISEPSQTVQVNTLEEGEYHDMKCYLNNTDDLVNHMIMNI